MYTHIIKAYKLNRIFIFHMPKDGGQIELEMKGKEIWQRISKGGVFDGAPLCANSFDEFKHLVHNWYVAYMRKLA